jgi:hypothetical protein
VQNDWPGLAEGSKSKVLLVAGRMGRSLRGDVGRERLRNEKNCFLRRISFLGLITVIWPDPIPVGQQIVTIQSADGAILTWTYWG